MTDSDAAQSLIDAAEAKALEVRATAEREIAKLEGYIQGIRDAQRVLGEVDRPLLPSPGHASKGTKKARIVRRRRNAGVKFREGSVPDQVRSIIRQARKPVHLAQVVKKLSRGGKTVSLISVENRIAALARKGAAFVRTAPRTYGLIEMAHSAQG